MDKVRENEWIKDLTHVKFQNRIFLHQNMQFSFPSLLTTIHPFKKPMPSIFKLNILAANL